MKKITKIFLVSLIVFCLGALPAFAASTIEFSIGKAEMFKNSGTIEKSDLLAAPYIKDGRTMVPLRAISEAFGSSVTWDDATKTVGISSNNKTISLVVGENKMLVDGVEKPLDYVSEIVNSTTFIPLSAVSENLGFYVYFVDATKQILIDDTMPAFILGNTPVPYNEIATMYEITKPAAESFKNQDEFNQANYSTIFSIYQYLDSIASTNEIIGEYASLTDDEKAEIINATSDNANLPSSKILSGSFAKIMQDSILMEKAQSAFIESVKIPIEEAEKIYKENYVCAKHVLVAISENRSDEEAKALADEIYKRAAAGEDFDLLINEYGEDPGMANAPDGYVFTKGEMVVEFEEGTYALRDEQISEPIKTSYGYHIIKRLPLPNDEKFINSLRGELAYNQASAEFSKENEKLEIVVNISPEEFFNYYNGSAE